LPFKKLVIHPSCTRIAAIKEACLGLRLTPPNFLEFFSTHSPNPPSVGSVILNPPGIVDPEKCFRIALKNPAEMYGLPVNSIVTPCKQSPSYVNCVLRLRLPSVQIVCIVLNPFHRIGPKISLNKRGVEIFSPDAPLTHYVLRSTPHVIHYAEYAQCRRHARYILCLPTAVCLYDALLSGCRVRSGLCKPSPQRG